MYNKELIIEGQKITGIQSEDELINIALKELIEHRKQNKILDYEGKVKWEGDLNNMRRTRF